MNGQSDLDEVLERARRLDRPDQLRLIEHLVRELRAALPAQAARAAAAPSPEDLQQMRDEIFHDF